VKSTSGTFGQVTDTVLLADRGLPDDATRGTAFVYRIPMSHFGSVTGLACVVCLVCGGGFGCANSSYAPSAQVTEQVQEPDYDDAVAAALAFDPPVAANEAPLELSRAARGPVAVLGYQESISEYFYLRNDDRQTNDFSDRFEHRAVSEKVGVLYR
jgi:hypothetical protein